MNPRSIPEAFRRAAAEFADAPAVRLPGRNLSFREIDRASDRIAANLAPRGIGKGDRVGLYCINGPEFAMAYLGVLKSGATVVPVNLLLSPGEVNYILGDAGVSALFYHQALAGKAAEARQGLEKLELAIAIGDGEATTAGDAVLAEWLAGEGTAPEPAFDPAEDVAAILYTAGTTGYPKGAQLTHGNLLADSASVCRVLRLKAREDVLLVVLPMFHSFAATVGMLTPLLNGLSFAPVPKFEPGLVVDHIEATGATVFLGVPSMYALFLKLPQEQLPRWRSVRFCVSGGAALPVAVLIGGTTGSAGEMTATIFNGRPDTRVFGFPTAGRLAPVIGLPLEDGAVMTIAAYRFTDRQGNQYDPIERLQPDDVGGGTQPAVDWLLNHDTCTHN